MHTYIPHKHVHFQAHAPVITAKHAIVPGISCAGTSFDDVTHTHGPRDLRVSSPDPAQQTARQTIAQVF